MTVYKNINNFFRKKVKPMLPQSGDIIMKANIPSGQEDYYLKCDGKEYSRLEEEELFKVIGITYGEGDGKNTFNVPDYRGLVPRGLDEGREIDKDRKLGTIQEDQNKSHNHLANSNITGNHEHDASSSNAGEHKHINGNRVIHDASDGEYGSIRKGKAYKPLARWDGGNYANYKLAYTSSVENHSHSINVVENGNHEHIITVKSNGGNETRMKNISTLFYIRRKAI